MYSMSHLQAHHLQATSGHACLPRDRCCAQADAHKLPELLKSVSAETVRRMQTALSHVWRRFLYSDYLAFPEGLKNHRHRLAGDMDAERWPHGSPPAEYHGPYSRDDAFGTIVQWLYHRWLQDRMAGAT